MSSDNPEIPIIWHLTKGVSRMEVLLSTRNKALSMKQAVFDDMFKKASKSACTSSVVVPSELHLLLHQLYQLRRHHKTQKTTLMTLNQQMNKVSQRNTPPIICTAKVKEQQQRIICKDRGQYRHQLIIWNIRYISICPVQSQSD